MKDFKGKTAFITGAASGIGLGMARAFGREGMNVVIADIDRNAAQAAAEKLSAEQIKAVPVFIDVTERSAVKSAALDAVAAFGKVHVVCNNAGIGAGGAIGQVTDRDWDWTLDVNLKGVVYGVETFVPLIRSHGEGGHIVNTASLAGMLSAPGMEPYSASKFAVVAMSEGWAVQLAGENIGVSVLCPGFVSTNIFASQRARQDRYGGKSDATFAREQIQSGMNPDTVGQRVVEAVKHGQVYIFTHPQFRKVVEARFERIMAGFDDAERSEVLKHVKQWGPVPGDISELDMRDANG